MKKIASTAVACLFFLALASPVFSEGSQMQEGKMPEKTNMMQGSEAETGGYMHHMNPEMMQQCRRTHEEYAKNLASVQALIDQSKTQKNTDQRLDSLTSALDMLVKSMETRRQSCPGAKWMMQGGHGMMQGTGQQHSMGNM